MVDEVVVVGFPKCGTSALMRQFMEDPEVDVLTPPNGGLEVVWPMIKELDWGRVGRLRVHKYAAYVYNLGAVRYLQDVNPKAVFVLCIRHPLKVLVSWHNMHRSMAKDGRNPRHFAYRERDFYENCSISEYYDHYARKKLGYDKYFNDLLSVVSAKNLIVVSQESMAKNMDSVVDFVKSAATGVASGASEDLVKDGQGAYQGYADRNFSAAEIDEEVALEMERIQSALYQAIRESGVRHHIL